MNIHKTIPSSLGEVVLCLIHINKQKIKQNEETEEYAPNERTSQNFRKKTKETEISNLPDKEFNGHKDAHQTGEMNG